MPFGGYKDFDECEDKNKDKQDPGAYCGEIKHRTEDKAINKMRRVLKEVRDPYAVGTAVAEEMGYSDFSEGSEGRSKRDEIAEAVAAKKSRDPENLVANLGNLLKQLQK